MTTGIIITLCSILLLAYLFDLSASKTRVPSVILLLLSGWLMHQAANWLDLPLPDFSPVLPVLGTVGLILIVLEGSLELELNASKKKLIRQSFACAFFPLVACSFLLAWLFLRAGSTPFRADLINAIPLCVISSAIAIPTVKKLNVFSREFITYESSFSDILGVLLFNFVALNASYGWAPFGRFGIELVVMIAVSFIATAALSFLLSKIDHHIKFIPIILLVILIYAVTKAYHLPALLFIMVFGLCLGNLKEISHFNWMKRFKPWELGKEIEKFREITGEAAFIIRALFFLLFGYLIETRELLNTTTLKWALAIASIFFIFRWVQLRFSRLPVRPLLFIAPRGLITILLYLSIETGQNIPLVNKSLIIQVIIVTALIMMIGMLVAQDPVLVEAVPATGEEELSVENGQQEHVEKLL